MLGIKYVGVFLGGWVGGWSETGKRDSSQAEGGRRMSAPNSQVSRLA